MAEDDAPRPIKLWQHSADSIMIDEFDNNENYTIEIFTDGSNNNGKVGTAGVIYEEGNIVHKVRKKLHDKCSNIQAEGVEIISALQAIKSEDVLYEEKKIALYADSKVTLDLVRSTSRHNNLTETIRGYIKSIREKTRTIKLAG